MTTVNELSADIERAKQTIAQLKAANEAADKEYSGLQEEMKRRDLERAEADRQ